MMVIPPLCEFFLFRDVFAKQSDQKYHGKSKNGIGNKIFFDRIGTKTEHLQIPLFQKQYENKCSYYYAKHNDSFVDRNKAYAYENDREYKYKYNLQKKLSFACSNTINR